MADQNASTNKQVELDKAGILHASVAEAELDKVTILPGHESDYSACTFCLAREDHTLGNALRWMIMKDPDVEYCGYSAPHPSEDKIHLRIQMYDSLSAVDCLRKALGNLRDLFVSIQTKYSESLAAREFTVFKDIDIREAVDAQVAESRAKTAKKNAGGSKKSGSASTANGASAGTTAGDVEMS